MPFARVIQEGRMPTASELLEAVNRAFDTAAKGVSEEFEGTTHNWSDRPKFSIRRVSTTFTISRSISTEHEDLYYVNFGTKVRRALLSRDWQSKTSPGVLGSGAGAGHVIAYSKKFEFEGIKARRFDKLIADKWGEKLQRLVVDELAKTVQK